MTYFCSQLYFYFKPEPFIFSGLMKTPFIQFFLDPTIKSYQDFVAHKLASSSLDQAASTSDENLECRADNPRVAMAVEQCSKQKAKKVIPANVPTATTKLTIPTPPTTTKKIAVTSNPRVSNQKKPILHSAAIKADCRSIANPAPKPILAMPPMPIKASVSPLDLSLRTTQVTDITAQMAEYTVGCCCCSRCCVSEPMNNYLIA